MNKPIYVTQPYLPPLEEFTPYLEKIWDNKILTNGGPFHQQLEKALCEYLGVEHVALFSNGTIALITALQALRITGEVITTPYSFVATAHSLLWNGNKPVFVDVEPTTLNIDPAKIEAALAPECDSDDLLKVVGWPQAAGCVVVVGHQPILGQTLARLLGLQGQELAVKKGAVWWLRTRQRYGAPETVLLTVQHPDLL